LLRNCYSKFTIVDQVLDVALTLMLGIISYSLLLLALFIGAWRRPAVGLAAVLCLYGLKQWGQSSTAILSEYRQFTNYAVFVIVFIGVIRAAIRRSCVLCQAPTVAALVLILYSYALLTVSWAFDPGNSFEQWIGSAPYLVTIALLAPLLINNLDDVHAAFIWTALTGGAICALALVFGNWGDRGLVVYGHQALEDSSNVYLYETNPLALSTLGGTVFLVAGLSLGRANGVLVRVFALVCIPIALAVVLRSGSRGQMIASAVAFLVALPIAFRLKDARSLVALFAIAVVVLGLGWWSASLVDINASRWADSQATEDVVGRFAMAQALLGASTSGFLTTVFGLGNSSSFQVLGIYPHITGLEVLAEEGIVGAILYFAIIVLTIRSIKRVSGQGELTDRTRNALAMLSGLFVFELILSWKQGSLLFSVYVFAYAIMLGRLESPEVNAVLASSRAPDAGIVPRFQNLLR
jgi:hypothetical protein